MLGNLEKDYSEKGEEFAEKRLNTMYSSEVYGFNTNESKMRR